MKPEQDSNKIRNSISSTRASFNFESLKTTNTIQDGEIVDICRICLGEGVSKNNEYSNLIKACKCSGSLRYIH